MRAALAGCLALALGVAPAASQQDTVTLTLAEALRIAEGHNPEYMRAVNSTGLNAVEMRTVWLDQLLPSASLSLFSTGFTGNRRRLAVDNLGNPIQGTGEWIYFSDSSQQLTLGWSVQGASLLQAHRRQSLNNRSRELAQGTVRSDLGVEVRRLFWDALEQGELTRTEEELVEARSVDLSLTERLFALAQRSRVDVLNAELEVERQRLVLQRQRATSEAALLALRTELGDEELPPVRLAEEALPLFDPSSLDPDALVEHALSSNPLLMESRATVQSAELGVREARNRWWPEVSLGFNLWRQSRATGDTDALFDPWPGEGLESRFFAGLSLPVFNDYFQNRQQQYQATVEFENSVQTERQARLEIQQTIRGQHLELQNQWESLRLVERALAIAEEALSLRRGEYRLGAATFEELRQSIEQEATSRRDLVTARHAFVDALLNLEQAVGTGVRE